MKNTVILYTQTPKGDLPWCVCECHSNWAAGWEGTGLVLSQNLWTRSLLHLGCTTESLTL